MCKSTSGPRLGRDARFGSGDRERLFERLIFRGVNAGAGDSRVSSILVWKKKHKTPRTAFDTEFIGIYGRSAWTKPEIRLSVRFWRIVRVRDRRMTDGGHVDSCHIDCIPKMKNQKTSTKQILSLTPHFTHTYIHSKCIYWLYAS